MKLSFSSRVSDAPAPNSLFQFYLRLMTSITSGQPLLHPGCDNGCR